MRDELLCWAVRGAVCDDADGFCGGFVVAVVVFVGGSGAVVVRPGEDDGEEGGMVFAVV